MAGPDGTAQRLSPPSERPVSSDALLTAALARGELPAASADIPRSALTAFARVAKAVAAARSAMLAGQMVSEVLWSVWSSTDWPERLRTAALRAGGGYTTAASAHRDLDAVVALFELANRLPAQRRGEVGMAAFLEDINALRLPQEVRGAQESDRDHVRLLSAHRAKGLEWELVVVASVQEGQWPDVRLRSDLLHVAELGAGGRIDGLTHADLLAEERRLMYVACTRARSWLVVSAVAERVEGGLQASRFLAELGQEVQAMPARSASPMSAEGLIAALREAAQAPAVVLPDGSPDPRVEALRGAAVQRLAALALRARDSGPLGPVAAADPTRWWGAQPLTGWAESGASVDVRPGRPGGAGDRGHDGEPGRGRDARDPGLLGTATTPETPDEPPRPLRLSPSAVAALRDCPLRWFLDRRVGAGNPSGGAAVVGLVVHAVAEALARGDVAPDVREIGPFVDEIWASVPFPAHYQRVHERQRVDEMIAALLAWDASTGRSVAATELTFNLPVPGTSRPVQVSGSIDRVDRSEDGRLHVVDFKTGRTAASAAATAEHPQLGIYQLAIRLGALDGGVDSDSVPSAALGPAGARPPRRPVHLRHAEGAHPGPARRGLDVGSATWSSMPPGSPTARSTRRDRTGTASRAPSGSCARRSPLHPPDNQRHPLRLLTRRAAARARRRAADSGSGLDPTCRPSPWTCPARASPRRRSSNRCGGMTCDDATDDPATTRLRHRRPELTADAPHATCATPAPRPPAPRGARRPPRPDAHRRAVGVRQRTAGALRDRRGRGHRQDRRDGRARAVAGGVRFRRRA